MTENMAYEIERLVDGADVQDDYSGRGMFGKTTFGVIVPELKQALDAIFEIEEGNDEAFLDVPPHMLATNGLYRSRYCEQILRAMGYRLDSMGLQFIVY